MLPVYLLAVHAVSLPKVSNTVSSASAQCTVQSLTKQVSLQWCKISFLAVHSIIFTIDEKMSNAHYFSGIAEEQILKIITANSAQCTYRQC